MWWVLPLSIFLAVFQNVIMAGVGLFGARKKMLSSEGLQTLSKLNFYIFLPMFSLVEIARAMDLAKLSTFWLIFFSLIMNHVVNFLVGYLISLLLNTDYRMRKSWILSSMIGNIFALPGIIVEASCEGGGVLEDEEEYCKDAWGYFSLGTLFEAVFCCVIGLYLIQIDKKFDLMLRRKVLVVLHLYNTITEFLADRTQSGHNMKLLNATSEIRHITSPSILSPDRSPTRSLTSELGDIDSMYSSPPLRQELTDGRKLSEIPEASMDTSIDTAYVACSIGDEGSATQNIDTGDVVLMSEVGTPLEFKNQKSPNLVKVGKKGKKGKKKGKGKRKGSKERKSSESPKIKIVENMETEEFYRETNQRLNNKKSNNKNENKSKNPPLSPKSISSEEEADKRRKFMRAETLMVNIAEQLDPNIIKKDSEIHQDIKYTEEEIQIWNMVKEAEAGLEPRYTNEINDIYCSGGQMRQFNTRFEDLKRILTGSKYDMILNAKNTDEQEKVFDCKFFLGQFKEPPVIASLLGILIGCISPLRDAIFDEDSYTAMFVKTFEQIGKMTIVISMMLLGAKLSKGPRMAPEIRVKKKDIIGIGVQRLFIMPILGLLLIYCIRSISESSINDNKVLSFVLFAYWIVPSSTQLVAFFMIIRYGTSDYAILLFWQYAICVFTVTIACISFFAIYFP